MPFNNKNMFHYEQLEQQEQLHFLYSLSRATVIPNRSEPGEGVGDDAVAQSPEMESTASQTGCGISP